MLLSLFLKIKESRCRYFGLLLLHLLGLSNFLNYSSSSSGSVIVLYIILCLPVVGFDDNLIWSHQKWLFYTIMLVLIGVLKVRNPLVISIPSCVTSYDLVGKIQQVHQDGDNHHYEHNQVCIIFHY